LTDPGSHRPAARTPWTGDPRARETLSTGEIALVLGRVAAALAAFGLFLIAFLVAPLLVLAVFVTGLVAMERGARS
jgi:hypothetical protein